MKQKLDMQNLGALTKEKRVDKKYEFFESHILKTSFIYSLEAGREGIKFDLSCG